MSLDKASNAIVATVGFYADALATLESEREKATKALDVVATQLAVTMNLLRRADDLLGGLVSRAGREPIDAEDDKLLKEICIMSEVWHDELQKLTVVNVPKAPR